MTIRGRLRLIIAALCTSGACADQAGDTPDTTQVAHLGHATTLAQLVDRALSVRALLIGETHDRLDHHDNQLAIVREMHARGARLAIGLEAFERPAQEHLDAFVAGRLDAREMLLRTRWYERWRFDYRLYEPLLNFAREHHLPLVALNVPIEIVRKVGAGQADQLSPAERAFLPAETDRAVPGYRERLKTAWEEHRRSDGFENFVEAQLLWDEGMAETAVHYLRAHPERVMAIIAGNGHVEYGQGIAGRLARRLGAAAVTVVQADAPADPGVADFVLRSPATHLADPVRLGVSIEPESSPAKVSGFSPNSAAERAGVQHGDTILNVNDIAVTDYSELRAALHGRTAGETVTVGIRRQASGGAGTENVNVNVTLY